MKNKIIKGLTLLLFGLLLFTFVAYKSGFFSDFKTKYNEDDKSSVLNKNTEYTSQEVDSVKKREMMSSSKSLILIDHSADVLDSGEGKSELHKKTQPLLQSSKYGRIIDSKDLKTNDPDSSNIFMK